MLTTQTEQKSRRQPTGTPEGARRELQGPSATVQSQFLGLPSHGCSVVPRWYELQVIISVYCSAGATSKPSILDDRSGAGCLLPPHFWLEMLVSIVMVSTPVCVGRGSLWSCRDRTEGHLKNWGGVAEALGAGVSGINRAAWGAQD